jgi:hypothetical protein
MFYIGEIELFSGRPLIAIFTHMDLGVLNDQQESRESSTVYLEQMRLHFSGHDLPE